MDEFVEPATTPVLAICATSEDKISGVERKCLPERAVKSAYLSHTLN